jgi:hypothetical protein
MPSPGYEPSQLQILALVIPVLRRSISEPSGSHPLMKQTNLIYPHFQSLFWEQMIHSWSDFHCSISYVLTEVESIKYPNKNWFEFKCDFCTALKCNIIMWITAPGNFLLVLSYLICVDSWDLETQIMTEWTFLYLTTKLLTVQPK